GCHSEPATSDTACCSTVDPSSISSNHAGPLSAGSRTTPPAPESDTGSATSWPEPSRTDTVTDGSIGEASGLSMVITAAPPCRSTDVKYAWFAGSGNAHATVFPQNRSYPSQVDHPAAKSEPLSPVHATTRPSPNCHFTSSGSRRSEASTTCAPGLAPAKL